VPAECALSGAGNGGGAVRVEAEEAEVSTYLSQTRTQLRTGSKRSRVATIQSIAEFALQFALHENMHPRQWRRRCVTVPQFVQAVGGFIVAMTPRLVESALQ